MTKRVTRRTLLGALPAFGAWPALQARAEANAGKAGLKITKLVTFKSSLRWRDLLFLEVHTDGGVVGLGEATCHGGSTRSRQRCA